MWQLKHQNYWGFLIPEVHSEEIQNWLADQSTEIGCLRFQEALHRSTTKQFLNQGTLVFIYFFLLIKLTAKVLHTPNWRTNSQMQTEQNRQEEKEHGNICIRHTNHTRCSRKKNTTLNGTFSMSNGNSQSIYVQIEYDGVKSQYQQYI